MHILQVTPYYPPTFAYGGIPRVVHGLSRALRASGSQVSVLTTDALDSDSRHHCPTERWSDGIRVITFPNLSNQLAYHQQLFLPTRLLCWWLAGSGTHLPGALEALPPPDIVHLHGHRHLLNNVAVAMAKVWGVPYVMTPNGTLPRIERRQRVKFLWDLALAGRIPPGAARCIAVSRAEITQARAAGVPASRISLVPNGLDLGEFEPLPARGSFRRAWGIESDVPLVAYLGRLSPRKGVQHLLNAFLRNPPGGAILVVAGNESGRAPEPGPWTGDGITFTGLLRGRDRVALLVDADVLVYPSTHEIFGLVPFEGLLAGTPVVVGDDCGCGELISEAGAGFLVPHGDISALRTRIGALLKDPELRASMVARGRNYIESRLTWPRIARKHIQLYRESIREHGGARSANEVNP